MRDELRGEAPAAGWTRMSDDGPVAGYSFRGGSGACPVAAAGRMVS